MNKLIIFALVGMLVGCSANKPVEFPAAESSPRIIYRDLTLLKQIEEDVSEPKLDLTESLREQWLPAYPAVTAITAPFYVSFENESVKPVDQKKNPGLDSLLNGLDIKAQYLVVGYSHGSSSVGLDLLAKERAVFVADLLRDIGVPDSSITVFASSSGLGDEALSLSKKYPPRTFPALGVHVFKVK